MENRIKKGFSKVANYHEMEEAFKGWWLKDNGQAEYEAGTLTARDIFAAGFYAGKAGKNK